MKFVIQVCSKAKVEVGEELIGAIDKGATVFVGIGKEDTKEIADKMVKKLLGLRIYPDENGKTNISLKDFGGSLLIISQFTLYANCTHGNRPGFFEAGDPDKANELYEYIIEKCKEGDFETAHGSFGAEMKVSIVNEGPFTLILDSDEIFKK
ncbi:MAG: D-tyrosyl-tRNA(Tyr) deacylase [Lachnospiraceae bacterium]|nr:D-tyrosyl-tRNA(Tyr) deacylase [Lachnospiraceae bacterium]